ncbi:MAG: DUF4260 family protein [Rhodomicrobium sp.]|nr:DUF4260 family protein [Rhodomicrobium sp.]
MTVTLRAAQQIGALRGLGFVRGHIRVLLRLEGLAVFALACAAYSQSGSGWLLFAGLFLVPDLSFLGYLGGKTFGAIVYNAAHAYVLPLALLAAGFSIYPELKPYALIWIAHIGLDRGIVSPAM